MSENKVYYTGIGSRNTPLWVQKEITHLARYLDSKNLTLRTGGAPGADAAFAKGAVNKEVYIPWNKFQKLEHNGIDVFALNKMPNLEAAQVSVQKYHPNPEKLSPAANKLMQMNFYQLYGTNNQSSAFVICWTENAKAIGGTSQVMRIAKAKGIPLLNLGQFSNRKEYRLNIGSTLKELLKEAG